jgi:hypothetical protein
MALWCEYARGDCYFGLDEDTFAKVSCEQMQSFSLYGLGNEND